MARQFIVSGFPFPVFINETGTARQNVVAGIYFNETVQPPPLPAQAPLAWFDPDLIAGSWFDPELSIRGWYDREWANVLPAAKQVIADSGVYALTGAAATLTKLANKALVTGVGSYAVTGAATSLLHKWTVSTVSGAYALTGANATLRSSAVFTGPRQFIVSGVPFPVFVNETGTRQNVVAGIYLNETVQPPKIVVAEVGSYVLTGTAATLTRLANKTLAAVSGTYAITGTAAFAVHGCKLAALSANYALTGTTVTLQHLSRLTAASASYALNGTDAALTKRAGRILAANAGSYAVTGPAVALPRTYWIVAGAASYALTGTAATLSRSSEQIPIDVGGILRHRWLTRKDGDAEGGIIVVGVELIAGRATGSSRSVAQSIDISLRWIDGAVTGDAVAQGSMRLSGISLRAGFAEGEVNMSEQELLILAEAA